MMQCIYWNSHQLQIPTVLFVWWKILAGATKQTLQPLATNDLDNDSASDDEIMEEDLPNSGAGLQLLGAGDSSSGSCSVASQDDEDSTIGDAVIAV